MHLVLQGTIVDDRKFRADLIGGLGWIGEIDC